MRFGTFQLQSVPPWSNPHEIAQQQFDQMLAAEASGFDEVWLAEHNARPYAMIGNVWIVAAAVAAATERIRIGSAVSRLPLHHPLHLAEDMAWIDIISKGRVDFGVGRGYDPLEFETYGVSFDEREARWEETFDAINQMFATGSTAFEGEHYSLAEATLIPTPLQKPSIPLYVMVSGSERSIRLAAESLLPIVSGSGPTAEELRSRLSMYAQIASDAGHSDEKIATVLDRCWQLKPVHVAETWEKAVADYRRGLEWFMDAQGNRSQFGFASAKKPYEYYVEHHAVILGTPDSVAEELADYCHKSGVNNVITWFNMGGQPHAQVTDALGRFGENVLPKLRDVKFDWLTQLESAKGEPISAKI